MRNSATNPIGQRLAPRALVSGSAASHTSGMNAPPVQYARTADGVSIAYSTVGAIGVCLRAWF